MIARLCGAVLVFAPALAAAQAAGPAGPADRARLQAFTRSPAYLALLNRVVSGLPPEVYRRCPALVSNGSTVRLMKPVSFGPDGFPVAGSWKQSFPVSGCGADTTLNLFIEATAAGKLNTVVGMPGETQASPLLQHDAFPFARTSTLQLAPDCAAFRVANTRFDRFEAPLKPDRNPPIDPAARPWRETWTLAGCGKSYDVELSFVPQGPGTVIAAAPARPHP